MDTFIHLRSAAFPVLPGEQDEIVNEGTYGRALAVYLQDQLERRGRRVGGVVAEDWGWWVALDDAPFRFGVCVYSCFDEPPPPGAESEYVVTDGAPAPSRWRRRSADDVEAVVEATVDDLRAIFAADPEIEVLSTSETFPG